MMLKKTQRAGSMALLTTSRMLTVLLVAYQLLSAGIQTSKAQSETGATQVDPFEKIIISPHIEATLEQGDRETVLITDQKVPAEKIHIEVKNNALHIYLEDAKITTKQVKSRENGVKRSVPVYQGRQLTVRITYKTLNELAIRGEENVVFEGLLKAAEFTLKMYGEASLLVNDMQIDNLNATFYGENNFKSKSGAANEQAFKTYGDCIIDVRNSANNATRISSYGESEFYINAKDKISVLAFGDAKIRYKGQPEIEKTVSIGDTDIARIE